MNAESTLCKKSFDRQTGNSSMNELEADQFREAVRLAADDFRPLGKYRYLLGERNSDDAADLLRRKRPPDEPAIDVIVRCHDQGSRIDESSVPVPQERKRLPGFPVRTVHYR